MTLQRVSTHRGTRKRIAKKSSVAVAVASATVIIDVAVSLLLLLLLRLVWSWLGLVCHIHHIHRRRRRRRWATTFPHERVERAFSQAARRWRWMRRLYSEKVLASLVTSISRSETVLSRGDRCCSRVFIANSSLRGNSQAFIAPAQSVNCHWVLMCLVFWLRQLLLLSLSVESGLRYL